MWCFHFSSGRVIFRQFNSIDGGEGGNIQLLSSFHTVKSTVSVHFLMDFLKRNLIWDHYQYVKMLLQRLFKFGLHSHIADRDWRKGVARRTYNQVLTSCCNDLQWHVTASAKIKTHSLLPSHPSALTEYKRCVQLAFFCLCLCLTISPSCAQRGL